MTITINIGNLVVVIFAIIAVILVLSLIFNVMTKENPLNDRQVPLTPGIRLWFSGLWILVLVVIIYVLAKNLTLL